jgi:hypothetical protein
MDTSETLGGAGVLGTATAAAGWGELAGAGADAGTLGPSTAVGAGVPTTGWGVVGAVASGSRMTVIVSSRRRIQSATAPANSAASPTSAAATPSPTMRCRAGSDGVGGGDPNGPGVPLGSETGNGTGVSGGGTEEGLLVEEAVGPPGVFEGAAGADEGRRVGWGAEGGVKAAPGFGPIGLDSLHAIANACPKSTIRG